MSSRHLPSRKLRARSASPIKRLPGTAAPVAVALIASMWIAGCDTPANQEDRKVQAAVETAKAQMENGGDTAEARKALEQGAADLDITPLTKAFANNTLAQLEHNDATKLIQQIDQDDQRLHALIFEISQQAQQVDAMGAVAANYNNYDPKKAQDALAEKTAQAQQSLATVTQTISRLQGQIAKQSDDLKALQDQRTQVLDDADQADKSSEISKGQQSVDDFKRAADLRKQAGDLSVQIEKNQAQTVPLQSDLAVAQGQQAGFEQLLQQYQSQGQTLDAGWKSVQDAVAQQAVLQKQIVGGGGDQSAAAPAVAPAVAQPTDTGAVTVVVAPDAGGATGGAAGAASILPATAGKSLNEKADALAKLVQQISQERSDAISSLNDAKTHYAQAASAGQTNFAAMDLLVNDPTKAQRPEQDAWKSLEAVAHPAIYRMAQAIALRDLAGLYLSQIEDDVRLTQLQADVSKILGAANLPVPPALANTALDADKATAASSAADAYKAADDLINSIIHSAAPDPFPKIARVQHVLTLYGEVQLARATGDTATAQAALTQAKSELSDAVADGVVLPQLPPEITPPPAAPGANPGT